jgi:hypothetical protein
MILEGPFITSILLEYTPLSSVRRRTLVFAGQGDAISFNGSVTVFQLKKRYAAGDWSTPYSPGRGGCAAFFGMRPARDKDLVILGPQVVMFGMREMLWMIDWTASRGSFGWRPSLLIGIPGSRDVWIVTFRRAFRVRRRAIRIEDFGRCFFANRYIFHFVDDGIIRRFAARPAWLLVRWLRRDALADS